MNELLLHIPHSSKVIPDEYLADYFDGEELNETLLKLTDTFTEDLFSVDGVSKIIFPYSRAFCGIERFLNNEPMKDKFRQGYYYSNGINLKPFRHNESKVVVLENFYNPHHTLITGAHKLIQFELQNEENGFVAKKTIREKYESRRRADWAEFNVQWMLYVVWLKCLTNTDFSMLLATKIPADAIIIENSTRQKGANISFGGAVNKEFEDSRDVIEKFVVWSNPYANKKELERQAMIERTKINTIGILSGVNCMGKILKVCQIALITNSEPQIDYALLRSKKIYLIGELLAFRE